MRPADSALPPASVATPRRLPRWAQVAFAILAVTIATLGTLAVTVAGFTLSFDAIRAVAKAAHMNPRLAWMLPVAIDGVMAVASVTAIVMQRLGRRPWYPWAVVLANVLISVGCNALHAYQSGGAVPLPSEWAMAVSAIPAVEVALSLHLLIQLIQSLDTQSATLAALTDVRSDPRPETAKPAQGIPTKAAPAFSPASPNGSRQESQKPAQPPTLRESEAANKGESDAESGPETAPANPAEGAAEKVPEKAPPAARRFGHPLADDPRESVRKLARAYSRRPNGTNAELAKLAKVSEGTANRYLAEVRAAAVPDENAEDPEERAS